MRGTCDVMHILRESVALHYSQDPIIQECLGGQAQLVRGQTGPHSPRLSSNECVLFVLSAMREERPEPSESSIPVAGERIFR